MLTAGEEASTILSNHTRSLSIHRVIRGFGAIRGCGIGDPYCVSTVLCIQPCTIYDNGCKTRRNLLVVIGKDPGEPCCYRASAGSADTEEKPVAALCDSRLDIACPISYTAQAHTKQRLIMCNQTSHNKAPARFPRPAGANHSCNADRQRRLEEQSGTLRIWYKTATTAFVGSVGKAGPAPDTFGMAIDVFDNSVWPNGGWSRQYLTILISANLSRWLTSCK